MFVLVLCSSWRLFFLSSKMLNLVTVIQGSSLYTEKVGYLFYTTAKNTKFGNFSLNFSLNFSPKLSPTNRLYQFFQTLSALCTSNFWTTQSLFTQNMTLKMVLLKIRRNYIIAIELLEFNQLFHKNSRNSSQFINFQKMRLLSGRGK